MTFYLLCPSKVSQAFARIFYKQFSNQVFYFRAKRKLAWKLHLLIENPLLSFVFWRVRLIERRTANNHFEEESTQTVIIYLEGVPLSYKNFGTHVF